MGKKWKLWQIFFSWAPKPLWMVTAAMKLKDTCSLEGKLWQTSDQIRSVAQSCLTLCDPMNYSMPGLPVHHQLPEFTQTHVHRVSDAIQPSHPLSSSSPLAPNPSQHQSLSQWVNSSHEVAKYGHQVVKSSTVSNFASSLEFNYRLHTLFHVYLTF